MRVVYLLASFFVAEAYGASAQQRRAEDLAPRAATTCPTPTTTKTVLTTSTVKTTTTIKATTTSTSTRIIYSTTRIPTTTTITTTKTSTSVLTSTSCLSTATTTTTLTATATPTCGTTCPDGKVCGACGCSYEKYHGYVIAQGAFATSDNASADVCYKKCDDTPNCVMVSVQFQDTTIYCDFFTDPNDIDKAQHDDSSPDIVAQRITGECTNNQCYGYIEPGSRRLRF